MLLIIFWLGLGTVDQHSGRFYGGEAPAPLLITGHVEQCPAIEFLYKISILY